MPISGTLTKAKIIDAVAESNGYQRKKSIETVGTVFELIKRSLESGEDVLISGFGKFCVKKKRDGKFSIQYYCDDECDHDKTYNICVINILNICFSKR